MIFITCDDLALISQSLHCNPAIFEVFQSPLHSRSILVKTSRSSLDHLYTEMTERLSNNTWGSLGHLKTSQDTVGHGCDMSTRVNRTAIAYNVTINLQNTAPKAASTWFENSAILTASKNVLWSPNVLLSGLYCFVSTEYGNTVKRCLFYWIWSDPGMNYSKWV